LTLFDYQGNVDDMAIAHSKLTAQGQISVPAGVRKKLGVGPGSVIEWHDEGGKVVVRKASRFTSKDIHDALFAERAPQSGLTVKQAIRAHMRKRHARG
jgi:AbrB family looped-hinge helix DNA binding protein